MVSKSLLHKKIEKSKNLVVQKTLNLSVSKKCKYCSKKKKILLQSLK